MHPSRPLTSVLMVLALSACRGTPDAMSVALSPDPAYTTDDLTLMASLSEGDLAHADNFDIRLSWTVDGAAQADLDGATTVPADRTSKGELWEATAVANRGNHAGELAIANVTIANSLPVAQGALDANTAANADLVASASATDADDDTVSFTWAWTVDGTPADVSTDTVPADLTAKGQIWEVTITPNDGEASGEPVVLSTSIANVAPVVTEVTLSPVDPATDATLTADVVASDLDGDALLLRYEWLVDGIVAQDSDANTLDGSLFDKHQTVSVRVTPNDGFVDGAAFESNALTVVNSAPSLTGAAIDAAELRTTDNPACLASGWMDLDGDPQDVRYAWSVNGIVVGTSQSLDAALFVKGDLVACSATPWDGEVEGATVRSGLLTVLNTAPTLASAALSNTSPTAADTLSVVLAGANDADGDAISYAYSWSVNGVAVATTDTLDGASFKRGDTIVVTVTPNDGTADGAPVTSDTATVVNTPPAMVSAVIDPAAPNTNDTLSANVSATDADGDNVSYTYAWTVNGSPAGTGATLAGAAFSKHDVIGLSVTANDGNVNGAPLAAAPVTAINTAPVIVGVNLSETSPTEASTVTCLPAGWYDADGDAETYSYAWTVNRGQVATTASIDGALFAKGDTIACTATPFDGEDSGLALTSAPATVLNTAPVLESATLSSVAPKEGDTLSVNLGAASDADGDAISYTYAWFVNSAKVATSDSLDSSFFKRGDSVYVQVTPTDGPNAGALVTSDTATVANTAPVIVVAALKPVQPNTDATISVNVGATDADGDALSYTYAWTVDGVPAGTAATLPGSAFVKHQVVGLVITAHDGIADSAPYTTGTLTVVNTPPSITSVGLSDLIPKEASVITCQPTGWADLDGDHAGYGYSWLVNSVEVSTLLTIDGSKFKKGDTVQCVVTPNDGDDDGSPVNSKVVTVLNTAPTLASAALSSTAPKEGDTLSVNLGATFDADGDPVNTTYTWYVNSVSVANTSTLGSALFKKGDKIYVVVTPNDGSIAGAPATSNTATVANTTPAMVSALISPASPYTNDTLSVSVSSTDADGDAVSYGYVWTVDGVSAGTSATLAGTAFSKQQVVKVTVTPNDGSITGASLTSAGVTVLNTAPVAPSIALSPSLLLKGEPIQCLVTVGSTDADGDAISYDFVWTVNGVFYTGPATQTDFPGDTVPAGVTLGGDVWKCEATATDGAAFSSPVTASGTVTATVIPGSTLLTAQQADQINTWIGTPGQRWQPCYRKTTNGAASTTFHSLCDNKGPTITVIKLSTGKLIGGYDATSWTSSNGYVSSVPNFLFSLTNSFKHAQQGTYWPGYNYSTYNTAAYGPTFGGGHDLNVTTTMNGGYCNIGYSYACRVGNTGSATCQNDFCGSYNAWTVTELEVYYKMP